MVPARVILLHIAQADLTGPAKIRTRSTARRIDRHQTGILCGLKDSATARLSLTASGVEPSRCATIHQPIAVITIQIDFRIVGPALRSCLRVKCNHAIEGRGQIESSIDKKRRGLKSASLPSAASLGNISRVKRPCNFQL